ncbi:hydrogenase expression/formation protein HypE [Candidatus Aerophobetes bacterium]|uniref:Hydrogenase expression/formation protein HypE n=1 Tax=Aerophobetes bacterium TaxID=2030807 RepID=A0A523UR96_UNCAE|nr:MAG: hydrogenase expression/formation protein HypE [Candidatus Aerophobetes bacterium]
MKKKILLAHGSGGRLAHELIKDVFLRSFNNKFLRPLGDSAIFDKEKIRWAFTTDSYVIRPLFFPGGDIGKLAVCGTVNDLAVAGAAPLFLSCALIIEEGLEFSTLEKIVSSIKEAAEGAGVQIITGDTKVVEHGGADGLFINTSGVGIVRAREDLSPGRIEAGDRIIINGTIGDHSIATLSGREEFDFQTEIESDCAPLNELIGMALSGSQDIKMMRDPTRGGVASIFNEIVSGQSFGIELWEEKIPIKEEVMSICEMLGFDPLYLANEGKVVLIAKEEETEKLLSILRSHPLGKESQIMGKVIPEPKGKVYLRTAIGTRRVVDMLTGEQLPRIC